MKRLTVLLVCLMIIVSAVCFAETEEDGEKTDLERILTDISDGWKVNVIISTLEYGPLASDTVDPAPFAERLLKGTVLAEPDDAFPDGEYAVLNVPEEQIRFDFSFAEGKENFVREVTDSGEAVYRMEFPEDTETANGIVVEWQAALVADTGATMEWTSEEEAPDMVGGIENGSYFIRVNMDVEDTGIWQADASDAEAVRLGRTEMKNGQFVARFDPAGDGSATVFIRHKQGIVCDKLYSFDLQVKDGAVTEETGGSFTTSPADDDLDPYVTGEWMEAETQFTQMSVSKNAARGWDIVIASPLTHGAYIFKATMLYDCEMDRFLYQNGMYFVVPITEEPDPELGDPVVTDTAGSIHFDGDGGANLRLVWNDSQHPDETVFERLP